MSAPRPRIWRSPRSDNDPGMRSLHAEQTDINAAGLPRRSATSRPAWPTRVNAAKARRGHAGEGSSAICRQPGVRPGSNPRSALPQLQSEAEAARVDLHQLSQLVRADLERDRPANALTPSWYRPPARRSSADAAPSKRQLIAAQPASFPWLVAMGLALVRGSAASRGFQTQGQLEMPRPGLPAIGILPERQAFGFGRPGGGIDAGASTTPSPWRAACCSIGGRRSLPRSFCSHPRCRGRERHSSPIALAQATPPRPAATRLLIDCDLRRPAVATQLLDMKRRGRGWRISVWRRAAAGCKRVPTAPSRSTSSRPAPGTANPPGSAGVTGGPGRC